MDGRVSIARIVVGWSERSEVQQTGVNKGSTVGLRCAHSNLQKTVILEFFVLSVVNKTGVTLNQVPILMDSIVLWLITSQRK